MRRVIQARHCKSAIPVRDKITGHWALANLRRSADCSGGTRAYRHATGPNSPDTHLRFALPVNTVPVVAHGGEAQPTASGGSAPDRVTGPV